MAGNPVSIFISYARKDEALMRELESHLKPLKRSRLVENWHDGYLIPGEEWEPKIRAQLEQAQIILLLISVDFINSDYCYDVELSKAIARHKTKEACVIPVILRDCMWEEMPISDMCLGELQALPKDARPIDDWEKRDKAFANVARGIRQRIQQLQQEQAAAEYAANLDYYGQEFARAINAEYPLSQGALDGLVAFQQQLGLKHEDVARVERPIVAPAEARYQQAKAQQAEAERQRQAAEARRRQKAEQERQAAEERRRQEQAAAVARQRQAEAERQRQAEIKALKSERGIDYTRLRDLLKAGDWKAADRETYEVMIRAVGKEPGNWFTKDELLNFPCADLLTIDSLWVKYSQGKFGFSVQKEIYVECGGKLDGEYPGDEIWYKFCDRVDWRRNGSYIRYNDVTFDTSSASRGHLPLVVAMLWIVVRFGGGRRISLLSHRDL